MSCLPAVIAYCWVLFQAVRSARSYFDEHDGRGLRELVRYFRYTYTPPSLSATPLSQQLADTLRAQILTGKIPPDRELLTEAALSEELGVGRSTSARAIAHLRASSLVVFVPGRGAFTATADVIARAKRSEQR